MSVVIQWAANPESDVVSYNVYKSDDQTEEGTYSLLGSVAQVLLATLTYTDSFGTPADFYKVTAVNTGAQESLATDALQAGSPITVRVFDRLTDGSGVPLVGEQVQATLSVQLAKVNDMVVQTRLTALTDEAGVWHLDLVPNASIVPTGTLWAFTIRGVTMRITVPTGTLVKYSSIAGTFQ